MPDTQVIEAKPKRDNGQTAVNYRKDNVRAWASVIGIRPAARKFGVKEMTALSWAHREHWDLPAVFKPLQRGLQEARNHAAISAHTAHAEVIAEQGEESRLYLSSAGLKASYQAALSNGSTLLGKVESQAVLNTARSLDVVHGWTAQRQQAPVVAVQVNMPTPEERAKLDAIDAQLDAITKRLTAPE